MARPNEGMKAAAKRALAQRAEYGRGGTRTGAIRARQIVAGENLSDSKTGYELGKEIKSISENVSILAMLGTFDTIDESELSSSGIGDKIVKPFESEKFIN